MRRASPLGLLLLLLIPGGPSAARADQVFREEVDVRLIEIEVRVTDPDGQPVSGLARGDFDVRIDGKRVDVEHFAEVGEGRPETAAAAAPEPPAAPAAPAAAAAPAEQRLFLVIYLDRAHLQPGELDGALEAVRQFVRDGLRPQDRVMLVDANRTLEVRHGFTSEPALLLATLDTLTPEPPRSRAMDEFPRLMHEIERTVQQGPDFLVRSRDDQPMILKTQIESYAEQVYQELQATAHYLHRLIPALSGLPGRKEILYLGGTLPTDTPQQLFNGWRSAFGPGSAYQRQRGNDDDFGRLAMVGPALEITPDQFEALFTDVAMDANRNGVTLDVIDVAGLRMDRERIVGTGNFSTVKSGGISFGSQPESGRRLGNAHTLEAMALETGGRALINSREFDTALAGLSRDLRSYYVLAFRPKDEDGELHALEVRLEGKNRRRYDVRTRSAFRGESRDYENADRAVSALLLGEADNPLGIELEAGAPEPAGDQDGVARLPLVVIFPIGKLTLLPEGDGVRGQVSLYVTSGDLENGASQVQKAQIPLRFPNDQLDDVRQRSVEYKLEIPIRTGSRRVAVTFRDDLLPIESTAVLELAP